MNRYSVRLEPAGALGLAAVECEQFLHLNLRGVVPRGLDGLEAEPGPPGGRQVQGCLHRDRRRRDREEALGFRLGEACGAEQRVESVTEAHYCPISFSILPRAAIRASTGDAREEREERTARDSGMIQKAFIPSNSRRSFVGTRSIMPLDPGERRGEVGRAAGDDRGPAVRGELAVAREGPDQKVTRAPDGGPTRQDEPEAPVVLPLVPSVPPPPMKNQFLKIQAQERLAKGDDHDVAVLHVAESVGENGLECILVQHSEARSRR